MYPALASNEANVVAMTWPFAPQAEQLRHKLAVGMVAFALYPGATARAHGQESVRMSVAGEAAAAARRQAALTPDRYNLRLGPTMWSVSAGLTLEANDNIRFEPTDEQADLALRPELDARMLWRASDKTSLNLGLGAGYCAYAIHSEFDRFFVAPSSELSLDLYAGDFWFNLHERLSISADSYADPTVFGTGNYSQLQNTAGLSVNWDLNKALLTVSYDHANYIAVTGGPGLGNGDSDVFALSAGYQLSPTSQVGIQTGGGLIGYGGERPQVEQAADWNLGAFLGMQPIQYVNLRASAGYTSYAPQSGTAVTQSEFTGVYASIEAQHRVNKHLEYGLTAGRSISFGFYAGTIDLYSAVLEGRWHLFQKLSLGTGFEYEHGSQVLVGSETFDRFGPRLSLERPITAKMSGALRYQYYQRQSNTPGGAYTVNILTLSVRCRL